MDLATVRFDVLYAQPSQCRPTDATVLRKPEGLLAELKIRMHDVPIARGTATHNASPLSGNSQHVATTV